MHLSVQWTWFYYGEFIIIHHNFIVCWAKCKAEVYCILIVFSTFIQVQCLKINSLSKMADNLIDTTLNIILLNSGIWQSLKHWLQNILQMAAILPYACFPSKCYLYLEGAKILYQYSSNLLKSKFLNFKQLYQERFFFHC